MAAQAAAARSCGVTRARRARLGSSRIGSNVVRGRCARRGAVKCVGERRDQRGAAARRSVRRRDHARPSAARGHVRPLARRPAARAGRERDRARRRADTGRQEKAAGAPRLPLCVLDGERVAHGGERGRDVRPPAARRAARARARAGNCVGTDGSAVVAASCAALRFVRAASAPSGRWRFCGPPN